MLFFTLMSFFLEIIASYDRMSRHILFVLIAINQIIILIYPLVISYSFKGNMVLCSFMMQLATSTCLKLISFHHTMHDVRYLCKKVIKVKSKGEDLEPSKIEGTILGI